MKRGWAGRNILAMSFASLLTDVSSESVYAVLPFYINGVLGYGKDIVGLIEGVGEAVASVFKLVGGFLAEKVRRYKALALMGYMLSSFTKPLLAYTSHWLQVLGVKAVDRVGKGIRAAPRDTLLSASASTGERGRAFGLHRAMDTVGALLGPILAFALLPIIGYAGIFLFSIVPGLAAVLVLALFVRDIDVNSEKREAIITASIGSPAFYVFLASLAMAGLAGYTHAFLLLKAGEAGWDIEDSLLLLSLSNIVYAAIAYSAGIMSDKTGAHMIYPAGFAAETAGAAMVALYGGVAMLQPAFFIVYGAYLGLRDTLSRVIVGQIIEPAAKSRAYGYMHSTYGFSALAGYYIAGYIYQVYGYTAAFTYTSIISLTGLALSLYLAYMLSRETR